MKGLWLSLLLAAAAPAFGSQLEGPAGGAERVVPQGPPSTPHLPAQLSLDFSAAPSLDGKVIPLVPLLAAAHSDVLAAQSASALTPGAAAKTAKATQTETVGKPVAVVLPFARPQTKNQGETAATAAQALSSQAPAADELTEKAAEIPGEDAAARAGAMFREFAAKRESNLQPVAGRESSFIRRLLPSFGRRKEVKTVAAPQKPKRTYVRKLIFWNIVVYLLTLPLMPAAGAAFGIVPAHMRSVVLHGSPLGMAHAALTSVSYMFMHGSPMHLIGNMAVLWLFGRSVERWLGRPIFKKVYYLSGLAAALAGALFVYKPGTIVIGASAAIFGIVGAYIAALIKLRPWVRATDPRVWKRLLAAVHNIGLALLGALGLLLIGQNVRMLAAGGPVTHGIYVLGHVVGAVAGIDITLRLLRRPKAPSAS